MSEKLDGNSPSWYDEETNSDVYTTNFGQVKIQRETDEVIWCCIGIGRNQGNTPLSIKYWDDGEFSVYKNMFGKVSAELCSSHFEYPSKCKESLDLIEILEVLQKDDNYSIAAIAGKKELVKRLLNHFTFSKSESYELHKLFLIWRKPITKRTPIIKRTPILKEKII